MKISMGILYDIILVFYHLGIRSASLFSAKARAWVRGRKGQWQRLETESAAFPRDKSVIWMHCASVGEFEQGRPVLEKLRKAPSPPYIILTFYSPSGFELLRGTPLADRVYYLPADGAGNARRFVDLIRPSAAIFVKYEFWHHYLTALREAGVPHFLVAGTFRKDQYFFKPYGRFFLGDLRGFARLYLQDQPSLELLTFHGIQGARVVGDPRADRVGQIAADPFSDPALEVLAAQGPIAVWGSTWERDERLLAETLRIGGDQLRGWKFILVPHEPSETNIERAMRLFAPWGAQRYSSGEPLPECRIYVIDRIGLLSRLYRYGKWAYVGGGFQKGIHNILEPAAYGLPVLFGPRHQKFHEAQGLVQCGAACSIENAQELLKAMALLTNEHLCRASDAAKTYVKKSQGAADAISSDISYFAWGADIDDKAV